MTDDGIDQLYRLPPGEFTTARNVLAKARGAAGAAIKALEKPSLPAWGVNQVYWHDRSTFDALVEASTTMRQAHVQVISGRSADVGAAEAAHAVALKAAVSSARRLIEAAGEKATPATIDAITETLQALPTDDEPGRLTKPLKPMGFGALMSLGIPVVPAFAKATAGKPSRTLRAAAKALKAATAAEEKAEAAHAEAKKAAADVQRELARVRDRVQFLEKQRHDAEVVLRQRARALQEATNARIQAAQDTLL
jgi:hypothetical protein